jgi:uncharacterized protein YbgA (DUF1722 family)
MYLFRKAGCFKLIRYRDQTAEIEELIADFRRELVPLLAPLTLLRHHVRRLGVSYLLGQLYLEPNPRELMLRNHA